MAEIKVAAYTDQGTRTVNEDSYRYVAEGERACFVLADGLGGHEQGEAASRTAVDYMTGHFTEMEKLTEEGILKLLLGADEAVRAEQKEKGEMRTTVAAAFIEEGQFWYAHAGDSRCYYLKNGCIYVRTKDHSIPQLEVSLGDIRTEEIRFHPARNQLLKVLGNEEELLIDHLDEPVSIEPGDAFLLCSDGFWEYVFETEMELDLIKSESPKEWVEYMVKRLLLRPAAQRDNFTVLAGWIV